MNQFDRTPNYLSLYTDQQMKVGFKSLTIDEIDQQEAAIVRLFCLTRDRDKFLTYHQNKLQERLLNETSTSHEAEELFIKKLSVESGVQAVSKI